MNHRKTETEKVSTVCSSVRLRYKQAILAYVKQDGSGSVANVMGKVLEKWVEDNGLLKLAAPTINEDQEVLEFREDD